MLSWIRIRRIFKLGIICWDMRERIFLAFVFLLCVSFIGAYSHAEPEVLISFGNGFMANLNESSSNGFLFSGGAPSLDYSTSLLDNFGHDSSQVWVSVDGVESTLEDALNGAGLCGNSSVPYASGLSAGHFADEIDYPGYSDFQAAIDSGEFCRFYSWSFGNGSCSAPVVTPFNEVVYNGGWCQLSLSKTSETKSSVSAKCLNSTGDEVADSFCTEPKPADLSICSLVIRYDGSIGDMSPCGGGAGPARSFYGLDPRAASYSWRIQWYDHGWYVMTGSGVKPEGQTTVATGVYTHQGAIVSITLNIINP